MDSEVLTVDLESQTIDWEVIVTDDLATVEKVKKVEKDLEVDSAFQVQSETEEVVPEAQQLPTTTDLVALIIMD